MSQTDDQLMNLALTLGEAFIDDLHESSLIREDEIKRAAQGARDAASYWAGCVVNLDMEEIETYLRDYAHTNGYGKRKAS